MVTICNDLTKDEVVFLSEDWQPDLESGNYTCKVLFVVRCTPGYTRNSKGNCVEVQSVTQKPTDFSQLFDVFK